MTVHEAANKNPLVLAFIGDAYWTLYVRKMLIEQSHDKVNVLHQNTNKYVCASAQSVFYKKIAPFLNETEISIAGRARNANQHSTAKNAKLMDYKYATAFEAVVGYNILADNIKRVNNLFDIIFKDDDDNK